MPTAPKTEKEFKLVPEGTHVARCYKVIHIGTIEDSYLGQPKWSNKIRLSFELPTELEIFKEENGPEPFTIHGKYTLSMGEKSNLRPIVEGIIGTRLDEEEAYNFNINAIAGLPCLLTVVHNVSKANGKTYANIKTVAPLVKGMTVPDPVNPKVVLDYDQWDQAVFDKLPSWMQDEMKGSDEYKKKFVTSAGADLNEAPF